MRPLIKFILHASLVVAFIALMTAAFTPMAHAAHDDDNTTWLVIVDWDDMGEPFIHEDNKPVALDSFTECVVLGRFMTSLIETYEKDRRFVAACIHPDTVPLDGVIDMLIDDFDGYFPPRVRRKIGQPI